MDNRLNVDAEVDSVLNFLRQKMKERGFSQVKVQSTLGWKGSYISQLFNRTKALRVEQILMILDVIGIEPLDFYSEYYLVYKRQGHLSSSADKAADEMLGVHRKSAALLYESHGFLERFFHSFTEVRTLLRSLVHLLVKKELITMEELRLSAEAIKKGPAVIPPSWNDQV